MRNPLYLCALCVLPWAGRAAAGEGEDPPAPDPHTYVFVADGLDPLELAGTRGLAARIREAGFPHTRYGAWYEVDQFEREIRAIAATDPDARFALIGYSMGTYKVRKAANRLAQDGVPVAVLGYIGGDFLDDGAYTRPPGVGRVVNVTGEGFLLTGGSLVANGTTICGATNLHLAGTKHFHLPGHPDTASVLLWELGRR